ERHGQPADPGVAPPATKSKRPESRGFGRFVFLAFGATSEPSAAERRPAPRGSDFPRCLFPEPEKTLPKRYSRNRYTRKVLSERASPAGPLAPSPEPTSRLAERRESRNGKGAPGLRGARSAPLHAARCIHLQPAARIAASFLSVQREVHDRGSGADRRERR